MYSKRRSDVALASADGGWQRAGLGNKLLKALEVLSCYSWCTSHSSQQTIPLSQTAAVACDPPGLFQTP